MARPLILRILGDPSSGINAVKKQQAALRELQSTTEKVAVSTQRAVQAQVAAAVKRDARLREEIELFHAVGAAAVKGSREQVAAANLAARAERRLAQSISVTAAESKKLAAAHKGSERELSRGVRGALAGSGVFQALGRSIAFASGGFLVFATASHLLRDSVDAAREAAVTQKQLATQFRASGVDLARYRDRIEESTQAVSRLAGFEDDELMRAFVNAFRGSQNVGAALKIQAVAADVARAKGISLAVASTALTKGYLGQATALRRLGVLVPQHAKGMALLAFVQGKFAGQAAASTTPLEKFHAALFQTEEVAGKALLPTINRLTLQLANWLGKSKNQVEVQRQLKQIVSGVGVVARGASGAIGLITKALGGWHNAIIEVAAVWTAFKVKAIVDAQLIAIANIEAAGITASAWRAALITTGWGAFVVASGLAAGYVISHWEKVKTWFASFWRWMQETADKAVLAMIEPFTHIPGLADKLGVHLGRDARKLKVQLQADIAILEQEEANAAAKAGTKPSARPPKEEPLPPGSLGPPRPGRNSLRRQIAVIDVALAKAALTETTVDDRALLVRRRAIFKQLAQHATNLKQRKEYWLEVGAIQSQIDQIDADNAQKRKDAADAALRARKAAFAAQKRHQLELLAAEKQALENQKRADQAHLTALKQQQTALKQRIKNITSAFQQAIQSALAGIGALGQGPVIAPTDFERKARLGVGLPSAAALVADVNRQNVNFAARERQIRTIQALVPGTTGTGKAAKAARSLRTKLGVDLQDLAPEQVAALAASPQDAAAFVRAYTARQKLATSIAKIEMRAQLVTLHAARINLARVKGAIAAETKVINHIKVEINGVQIRQRHVRSKTISQTTGTGPGLT